MPSENSGSGELANCKYCRGITLEKLANPTGYLHAPSRSSLVRSAQKCRLCSLLFRKDRSRHSSQLQLALESFSEDDAQTCLKVSHIANNSTVTRQQLSFFLYTVPDDPAVGYGITVKRTLSNTRSQDSFDLAAKWIDDCISSHDCSTHLSLREQENVYPSRLIDLNAFSTPSLDVKLVNNDGSKKNYITLSYCWGKSRTFTTTSRSLRLRMACVQFESLPKTFRDAVQIARQLQIRFLWIDALCIVQDDRLDWERESAKMGAIYSMSYLTIAADSGVDCNSGCFNVSSTTQELAFENVPFELTSKNTDGTQSRVFLWDPSRGVRRPTPPEIDGSPLAERGWVCQERILSPRILHYTKSQLFWECRQTLLAEDGLRPWSMWNGQAETIPGLARNLYGTTSDLSSRVRILDIWYTNVVAQSYSRRKLTRADDKLTAISGIARAFFRHFRCEYVAGLWQLDLGFSLSWRRRGPVVRPVVYRSPSFSWACLDAIVEWPIRSSGQEQSLEVEQSHIELAGEDPFGRISSCWIKVKGHVREALVVPRKRISAGRYDLVWELQSTTHKFLGTAFMDDDTLSDTPERMDCLILSEDEKLGQALILERTSDVEAQYIRKGVAEILGYDKDDKFFERDEMQTITIF